MIENAKKDLTDRVEARLPLAFLPMSEKRPGPLLIFGTSRTPPATNSNRERQQRRREICASLRRSDEEIEGLFVVAKIVAPWCSNRRLSTYNDDKVLVNR